MGSLPAGAPARRSNLIQVPSCEEHNQAKSGDDEYAACCIAMNAESSDLTTAVLKGTRLRAMLRNEGSLGQRIFSTARPVTVERYDTDRVFVAEGIRTGERVVTAGVHRLSPGEKVKLAAEKLQ